jgi:hypothetical protein
MRSEYSTIRQKFRDFDEFAQTARAWDLNIRQLGRGSFDGDLLQFGTGLAQVAYAAFRPDTYQQGEPPQGFRTFS